MAADDEGWEARMAARTRERHAAGRQLPGRAVAKHTWDFSVYMRPGESERILPQILAARCLGIEYGDPGPKLPAEVCRKCWGERHVWLGNTWGMEHAGGTMSGCKHACHEGEIWLA